MDEEIWSQFSDIEPVEQDDGPNPLVVIHYDAQCELLSTIG